MFKLNDQVEDKDGAEGTIVYIEDNLVYVELLNGVEMEYKTTDIFPVGTHEAEINKRMKAHSDKQNSNNPSTSDALINIIANDILKQIPEMEKIAHIFHDGVNDKLGVPSTWEQATGQQKLNVVASMLSSKTELLYAAYATNNMKALVTLAGDFVMKIKSKVDEEMKERNVS